MQKDEFYSMPSWKQSELKKPNGLFWVPSTKTVCQFVPLTWNAVQDFLSFYSFATVKWADIVYSSIVFNHFRPWPSFITSIDLRIVIYSAAKYSCCNILKYFLTYVICMRAYISYLPYFNFCIRFWAKNHENYHFYIHF